MTVPTVVDVTSGPTYGGSGNLSSPQTWSHTVSSGSNRVLYVVVGSETATSGVVANISGITYGSAPLTKVSGATTSVTEGVALAYVDVWYLDNPPTGTDTISVSWSVMAAHFECLSFGLQGAATGGPEATHTNSTTTDGPTLGDSVTTLSADALAISIFATNAEYTQSCNVGTSIATLLAAGTGGADGQRTSVVSLGVTSPGSQAFSWTSSTNFGRAVTATLSHAPPAASPTLTLTDLPDKEVFQRIPTVTGTSASVTISGTYTGTAPTTVEAKITAASGGATVQDWTALTSATISGGAFSGALSAPVGGGYHVQVRSKDSGGSVLATSSVGANTWYVGKRIGVIGSSTPARMFTDDTSLTPNAVAFKDDGTTRAAFATGSGGGAGAISFANQLIADEAGVPVMLLNFGVGGTVLKAQWDTSSYAGYTSFIAAATGRGGGKLEAVYCHVGSNDARNEAVTSQSDHETRLRQLASNLRTSMGQASLPFIFSASQRAPAEPSTSDIYWSWVRAAELNVMEDANNYMGAETYSAAISTTDSTHQTPAEMEIMGRKLARCFKANVLGQAINWKGPKPVSASYNASSGNLDVTFSVPYGTGVVTNDATNLKTAFVVRNSGGTAQTITSATIISPTVVRLVVPTGLGAGVTVEYATGTNPGTTAAGQNSTPAYLADNATAP